MSLLSKLTESLLSKSINFLKKKTNGSVMHQLLESLQIVMVVPALKYKVPIE